MSKTTPQDDISLNLTSIEKRLLEIDEEKTERTFNLKENYTNSIENIMEADDIAYLDIEKGKLQLMRQFILDRRNNWKARVFWSIVAPIIVATIVAYLTSVLIR